MTMTARVEPRPKAMRPIPWDVRCKACGGWLATVSGDTSWVRVRCISRRCPKYSEPQEMRRPNA